MEVIALSRKGEMSNFKPLLKNKDESDGICMIRFIDGVNGRFLGQTQKKGIEDVYLQVEESPNYFKYINQNLDFDDVFEIVDSKTISYKSQLYKIEIDYRQMDIDLNLILKAKKSKINGKEVERNMYIYLDKVAHTISSHLIDSDTNTNSVSNNPMYRKGTYSTILGDESKVILLQIHTHPFLEIDLNYKSGGAEVVNGAGTSEYDFNFAKDKKVLCVAIAKYQGETFLNGYDESKVKVYYIQQSATNWETVNTYQKGLISKPINITLDMIRKNSKVFFDDMIVLTKIA